MTHSFLSQVEGRTGDSAPSISKVPAAQEARHGDIIWAPAPATSAFRRLAARRKADHEPLARKVPLKLGCPDLLDEPAQVYHLGPRRLELGAAEQVEDVAGVYYPPARLAGCRCLWPRHPRALFSRPGAKKAPRAPPRKRP